MKEIIPFKKEIIFDKNIDEITSISLEHTLNIKNNDLNGDFIISGEYKSEESVIPFNKKIPFNIIVDDIYDTRFATIDIDDFYYEVKNNNTLFISIDVLIDKLEKVELEDVREIIKTLCKYKNVEIVSGAVCQDHVHLCVSVPPKMSISYFMGYLKGKSTLMVYDRHPQLQSKWDKAFWARGYYVATIGNVTEEAIKRYIAEQSEESKKEDNPSRL